ncbi:MAG: hypothetical protein ACNS62_05450 [Candidatus Cyclobacteriaceae bacterium M3_2C_046]
MTFYEFKASLQQDQPPAGIKPVIEALWYDAQGDWNKAHLIAQNVEDYTGAWVHAYLHRKEGDLSNASYWYSRSGKKMPDHLTLEQEWESISQELINN